MVEKDNNKKKKMDTERTNRTPGKYRMAGRRSTSYSGKFESSLPFLLARSLSCLEIRKQTPRNGTTKGQMIGVCVCGCVVVS